MKKKQAVFSYIDAHAQDMAEDLSKMVSIPSVNNSEVWDVDNEMEFQKWMAERLCRLGLDVDMWVEDPAGVRPNVVGTLKGSGGGRDIMLNGHCDVVPAYQPEKWDFPPFSGKIIDGRVYGRGSSDMKGGLASYIWAIEALRACGVRLRGSVIFASSVGEESGEGATIGAAAVARRGYRPPFALVAEGTNLELRIASSSIFMFEFIVKGKAVHGACRNQVIFPQPYGVPCGPEVGVDALDKALPFIEMFRRMETEWNQRWRHPAVGSGGHPTPDSQGGGVFTMSPCFIEGGIYRTSINPRLKVTYYVMHPPTVPRDEVIAEIRQNVAALAQTDGWLRENPPEVVAPSPRKPWDGYDTPEDCEGMVALKKTFKETFGRDAVITGLRAVCDCTWLGKEGIPAVLLGPGSTSQGVHGDNEHVYIANLVKCAKLYAAYMMDWCGAEK